LPSLITPPTIPSSRAHIWRRGKKKKRKNAMAPLFYACGLEIRKEICFSVEKKQNEGFVGGSGREGRYEKHHRSFAR